MSLKPSYCHGEGPGANLETSMAVQYKDYYQTLGVAKGVSQEEIRKAFRKLARQHHPDVAKDKKAAENKFKEINEAYEVLGDPEKRRKYDELGAGWEQRSNQTPPGWGNFPGGFPSDSFGGGDFSDFFQTFFGGSGPSAGGRARHGAAGGAQKKHLEAEVQVTVEEVLQGARKRVSFRRPPSMDLERLDVKVPAGVVPGQKIRLAGKGQHGGDLYLRVVLLEHPGYRIEGHDLVREVRVEPWLAVLGGEVHVTIPEGTVRLKVPAASQPGKRFRLSGKGLPSGGGARGDLYVELQVVVPEALTLEERAVWVKLQELRTQVASGR